MADSSVSDRFKRIWIEQKVADATLLVEIQTLLSERNPGFVPYEKDKLHLTVFHFGVPEDLYTDLKRHSPSLDHEHFIKSLDEMLSDLCGLIPTEIAIRSLGLDLLGYRRKPKVALIMENNEELDKYRNIVLTSLIGLMNDLDISNPEKVFDQSKNLSYSSKKDFIPHITLGMFEKKETLEIPEFENILVNLMPSQVVHYC
jgi:2'-5' RNA ligase